MGLHRDTKESLVHYGLLYKYGRRTGRAQFGFICYAPQAKLKVMGGVKVKVKPLNSRSWVVVGMGDVRSGNEQRKAAGSRR